MTDRLTADTITSDQLTDLYERLAQTEELLRVANDTSNRSEAERAKAVRRAKLADSVTAETKRLMERRTTTLRERAERAEATNARVRSLAEQWVKAGPPPLGTSMSRWWDARLAELRTAVINEPDHGAEDTTTFLVDRPFRSHRTSACGCTYGERCPNCRD
ncbi:hypothetical protein [Streptomyces cylindrosporus]|uniref:Uncharacterized protein n=1 Tax=Streptomyces cylindrosporus TaxID=2927583 RepID=A0ABS9Y2J3_9ACTN|nr:hypothetical protein [Streptomyces cylindrosporus]MCI3271419.1 hypothetical protein [Streptomyces cylindrosporus]